VLEFLHDSREELKKVTWPDRDEVTNFTGIVILTLVIMSIFLWAVDSTLMSIIKKVMK
jgi:preprotein translocase subunit SecE